MRSRLPRVWHCYDSGARDLLVVPAIGDQPYDGGWLSPLDRAIYPPVNVRRQPRPADACPPFKKDSVLRRPDEGVAMAHTVAPGCHTMLTGHGTGAVEPGAGEADPPFEVVWWDPAALQLGAEPPFGLRRQELISKEVALGAASSPADLDLQIRMGGAIEEMSIERADYGSMSEY